MVAEGPKNSYPNYKENKISIVAEDPALLRLESSFLSSPLFSINDHGSSLPVLEDGGTITFLMAPNVFPSFYNIGKLLGSFDGLWFSIGVANLLIFERPGTKVNSESAISYLKKAGNLSAFEQWTVKASRISAHRAEFHASDSSPFYCNISISENLPLNLKFAVSEFILSVDRFLTASKLFTPHYFERHSKTVTQASKRLVSDLSFLYGEPSFEASASVINAFGATNSSEARSRLAEPAYKEKKEELINDRNGRIIQFNSALSYLYSQAYSGSFPLFDHNGLVRRHSLLGLGSAISALFELVCQTEEAFALLPFDDFDKKTVYSTARVGTEYYNIFSDPSKHTNQLFAEDSLSAQIRTQTARLVAGDSRNLQSDYYNRLAFFSGRLGFREYDFSATAAIQVLVEAYSLEYHVINYTHEIIHDHVRAILTKNLLTIPQSILGTDIIAWVQEALTTLLQIHRKQFAGSLTYKQFFSLALINYCINARYFGSLSKESDHEMVVSQKVSYQAPTAHQLKLLIKHIYRDLNEIFVHVIDFSYIYKRDISGYVLSIWASWSTVSSVVIDLKQYIIRTLMIIGLSQKGNSMTRFEQAKSTFLSILPELHRRNEAVIFEHIRELLEKDEGHDLAYRFSNCIIVADIVYNFFVGNIESLLENGDDRVNSEKTAGKRPRKTKTSSKCTIWSPVILPAFL